MACTKPELSKVQNYLNNSSGTCRVCIKESKFMKALFSSDCKIVTRIQFCTGILLTENPILPSFICAECLSHLHIAHNFKNTCIESENTFRQLDLKVDVKTEELDDPNVKEEIEYLYEDEAAIDNLRKAGLLKKESVNPTLKAKRDPTDDLRKAALLEKESENTTIKSKCNPTKPEAIPNTTKNTIKLKETPDPTTISKVTPLSRRGTVAKQKQVHAIATTQTIKLRVVKCTEKYFNMICNKEKKVKKKRNTYRRIKFRKLCCRKCDMRFETKEDSIQHHKDIHKLSNYVCEVCGKEFVYSTALTAHKRIHVGSAVACAHCSYSTVHKSDLKKHLTIHTGERSFHCHACTSTFSTSSNLHNHIRIKHGGEKSFVCDYCNKGFFFKYMLERHMTVHTKTKRFMCSICHSHFSSRKNWKRHLLTLHAVSVSRAKPGRRKTNIVIESSPSIFDNENEKNKNNLNAVNKDKKLTE